MLKVYKLFSISLSFGAHQQQAHSFAKLKRSLFHSPQVQWLKEKWSSEKVEMSKCTDRNEEKNQQLCRCWRVEQVRWCWGLSGANHWRKTTICVDIEEEKCIVGNLQVHWCWRRDQQVHWCWRRDVHWCWRRDVHCWKSTSALVLKRRSTSALVLKKRCALVIEEEMNSCFATKEKTTSVLTHDEKNKCIDVEEEEMCKCVDAEDVQTGVLMHEWFVHKKRRARVLTNEKMTWCCYTWREINKCIGTQGRWTNALKRKRKQQLLWCWRREINKYVDAGEKQSKGTDIRKNELAWRDSNKLFGTEE